MNFVDGLSLELTLTLEKKIGFHPVNTGSAIGRTVRIFIDDDVIIASSRSLRLSQRSLE